MQVAFVNLSPPMYEGLLANHAGTGPTEAAIFQSLRLCDSALKTTNRGVRAMEDGSRENLV